MYLCFSMDAVFWVFGVGVGVVLLRVGYCTSFSLSLFSFFFFFFSLFTEIGPLAKVPEYIRVQLIVLCSYACLSRVILHPPVLYERYSYSVLWYSAHFMKKIVN